MSIETAMWPLQVAVVERLEKESALTSKVTGIYDVVAEEHTHPYITVAEPTTQQLETKTAYVEELAIVIHVWSVYPGKKEAIDILNEVVKAIGKGLSIEGPFKLLEVKKPTLQVIDDADMRIKHGMARLMVKIKNS
ncbi:DUF3168 domain-containing protein [Planomicrobium okeanokoites]|uniref:DUF3168 domain-containing protein n=1 Tax=Planomicrobium okeanokoites TaxID=244 RepID=UPI000A0356A1|nr:DUF3168 domain-containing protein [Planomicrobium okeanokoites]